LNVSVAASIMVYEKIRQTEGL